MVVCALNPADLLTCLQYQAPNAGSGPAPLSLTTVLDRSESMKGRKLDLLKKTNQFLVETMMKNSGLHDLGIVTYSNLVRTTEK